MTREEQRRYATLARIASESLATWSSTKPGTIHLAADDLENLLRNSNVELFKDYPAEVRRRMARVGHALPDGSFPIGTCADAEDAIHSIGRAAPGKRAKAQAHIRKRVRALRCSGTIFENWR